MAHIEEGEEARRTCDEMDPGNFKVQLALKEIRIVFLLLSSSHSFLLMAVGFYMYVCVCVCVCVCVFALWCYFLSTYQSLGIVLCAQQLNVTVTGIVCVLTELVIVRLTVLCGQFIGIFGR